jgi:hypothetical protein
VIIGTDERKRGCWPLGVVEELIVGKDGRIRGAKVHTEKSQVERVMQHLYPLELSVDKKEPVTAILNLKAETFRPKRDAAVAARLDLISSEHLDTKL